jgi:2'-5' RNA ligase
VPDPGREVLEPASLRLFVALELPEAWRDALAELQRRQERASPGYFRWVRPELMHLTLAFLGRQPSLLLNSVSSLLERAAAEVPAFHMSLGRVGTFGPPRAPRVLWVEALQPDGRLQQLRRALDQELRAAAITYDEKPLVPHITLGRANSRATGAFRLVESALVAPRHSVEQIVLMESKLSPRGPTYHVRGSAELRR